MSKFTSFTKENISDVRTKINDALIKLEAELGIKFDIGTISFSADTFKTALTAVIATEDPLLTDVHAQYIRDLKRYKGDAAVGKKVKIGGDDAIIVGLRGYSYIFKWVESSPRAKKYPGLRRLKFTAYDQVDCQVLGIPFNTNVATIFSKT